MFKFRNYNKGQEYNNRPLVKNSPEGIVAINEYLILFCVL